MKALLKYAPPHGLRLTLSGDGKPERSRFISHNDFGKDIDFAKATASAALVLAGYSVSG